VTADPDELRAQLRAQGEKLRAAQRADDEAHTEIAKLVRPAVDAGLSRHEITRLAGVGRPWINKILREAG
jgi:hypothetical protein